MPRPGSWHPVATIATASSKAGNRRGLRRISVPQRMAGAVRDRDRQRPAKVVVEECAVDVSARAAARINARIAAVRSGRRQDRPRRR